MYRKILPLLFVLGSANAFAQSPTLTADNISPVINDSFVTIVCDTNLVSPGVGGTSITWTFSSLFPSTVISPYYDTGSVFPFLNTEPGYGSLLGVATALGSTGAFMASTNAIVTPTGNGTTYNQASMTKLSQTGVYINSGNFAVYTDPMDQLRYPFTFGSTFTDTYAGGVVYTPAGTPITATENGSVTVSADGYGTLVLPAPSGTHLGVLRVHSSQAFRDSANIFNTPVVETIQLETYTWYQPGYHGALLTISTAVGTGVNTKTVSYAYKQIANHDAVPIVKGIDASLNIYPNPAANYLYITYNNADNSKVRTTLTDALGREVAVIADQVSQGVTNVTYNTASLAKGLYVVRLQSGDESVTRKIEIQ